MRRIKNQYKDLEEEMGWRFTRAVYPFLVTIWTLRPVGDTNQDNDLDSLFRLIVGTLFYFVIRRLAVYVYYGSKKKFKV